MSVIPCLYVCMQRFEDNRRRFQEYVQRRTLQNYKFWIVSSPNVCYTNSAMNCVSGMFVHDYFSAQSRPLPMCHVLPVDLQYVVQS